jgi:hypothetical protein
MRGHLAEGQETAVPKPIVAGLELVTDADIVESGWGEGASGAGAVARSVEHVDGFQFGVVVQQLIDAGDDGCLGSPKIGS